MSVITVKGQVTIPKKIRDGLGLRYGDELEFELRDGEAVIRKKMPDAVLGEWQGYLKTLSGSRSDDLVKELRGE